MSAKTQPVRIRNEVHAAVLELRAEVAQKGWSAFGITRPDPPTVSAVIEEAVKRLRSKR